MEKNHLGSPLDNWLRNIRDVRRIHFEELEAIKDHKKKVRRLIELNVTEQCLNLYKTHTIQKRRLQTFKDDKYEFTQPQIHGLVYDPASGLLRRIPTGINQYIDKYKDVYDTYDKDITFDEES